MVDIQPAAAEIRRGIKKNKIDRKKLQGKNIMALLLHRAAIIIKLKLHQRGDTSINASLFNFEKKSKRNRELFCYRYPTAFLLIAQDPNCTPTMFYP